MAFRMLCPKCGTGSYSIEKERSTYSRTEPVASLVFACTCGKRLYGKKVEEEYLRQKKGYEQDAETRTRQQVARAKMEKRQAEDSQTMTDALAYRARFEAKRKAKEEEEVSRSSQKELEEWRAKATDPAGDESGIAAGDEHSEECTWHQCDKGAAGSPAVRRKGSKYCSRDCSNKNARWRHKKRKSGPKTA
jgi:hypothetical protein